MLHTYWGCTAATAAEKDYGREDQTTRKWRSIVVPIVAATVRWQRRALIVIGWLVDPNRYLLSGVGG